MRPRKNAETEPKPDRAARSQTQPNVVTETAASYLGQAQGRYGDIATGDMPRGFGISAQPTSQAQRRRNAIDRFQTAWKRILDSAAPEDLERMASHAEAAFSPRTGPAQQNSLVQALSQGRAYTPEASAVLELDNQLRYFQERRGLLSGSLTSTQVAALLGTSRQTPHDRVNSGALIAISEQGRLMFPTWQFDPEGPNGVLRGLPEVLRALHLSPVSKVRWLTRANATLDGRTPVDAVKQGDIERVIEAARSVGAA